MLKLQPPPVCHLSSLCALVAQSRAVNGNLCCTFISILCQQLSRETLQYTHGFTRIYVYIARTVYIAQRSCKQSKIAANGDAMRIGTILYVPVVVMLWRQRVFWWWSFWVYTPPCSLHVHTPFLSTQHHNIISFNSYFCIRVQVWWYSPVMIWHKIKTI